MKKGFSLEISSDLDYEGMVVNIVFNPETIDLKKEYKEKVHKQHLVAILNQDKGIENTEIKIFPLKDECWTFSYNEFMGILEKAKELLIKINKEKRNV